MCGMDKEFSPERTPADVLVQDSKIEGKGVFAGRDFLKDETVIRWQTQVRLSREEARDLPGSVQKYLSRIKDNLYALLGSPERYVNHSCDPNTKVTGNADVAIRDIKKGEEITADYREELVPVSFACNCGSANCIKMYAESL
ncbi:SET domain-containing protein-lysine N-methyltransferase [Candidatus Kaiserbacteria bacterium]|nr:SET domain-containing protein-lysine N-methyltransferase [Candidatus Kaiserbacteria bacterium]